MKGNYVCTIDPSELPDDGTNEEGVEWSEVKETFVTFCGFDTDSGGFVNMTPDELDSWAESDCADKKSVNPEQVRERVRIPSTTHPKNWDSSGDIRTDDPDKMGILEMAKKANSFNARGYGSWKSLDNNYDTYDGVECPNGWGIAALNWQQDPGRTYEEFYQTEKDIRQKQEEIDNND